MIKTRLIIRKIWCTLEGRITTTSLQIFMCIDIHHINSTYHYLECWTQKAWMGQHIYSYLKLCIENYTCPFCCCFTNSIVFSSSYLRMYGTFKLLNFLIFLDFWFENFEHCKNLHIIWRNGPMRGRCLASSFQRTTAVLELIHPVNVLAVQFMQGVHIFQNQSVQSQASEQVWSEPELLKPELIHGQSEWSN